MNSDSFIGVDKMKVDSRIYQITIPTPFAVGDTHVYLIRGDVLTLVDAGIKTKEAKQALRIQLKEIGYTLNDIEQLILTHHHPDHTGLIEEFPRLESVLAHKHVNLWLKRDEHFFQSYEAFFNQLFREYSIPGNHDEIRHMLKSPLQFAGQGELTGILEDGKVLPGHNEWQVIETKGHAETHMSLFRSHDHAFIGGDHLLEHMASTPLLEAPYESGKQREKAILQYRNNLKKCLILDIKKVFPGHGPIFSDVEALILRRLKKQLLRAKYVRTIIDQDKLTPYNICRQVFPDYYKKQLDVTISETIGYLDLLEDLGQIEAVYEDGLLYYQGLGNSKANFYDKLKKNLDKEVE